MSGIAEDLLSKILRSPEQRYFDELEKYLRTDAGFHEFTSLLCANNQMAHVYLKQKAELFATNPDFAKYTTTEFITSIYSALSRQMSHLFMEYIDILSSHLRIDPNLIEWATSSGFPDILAAIFRKYTRLTRSNELFREINESIGITSPLFHKSYFSALNNSVQFEDGPTRPSRSDFPLFYNRFLLEALYCLLYQDIHPFFEDNADLLFKLFFILYDDLDCKPVVLKLYDLFLIKYPEFTNFLQIILSIVCNQQDSPSGELDPLESQILTRAYEYKPVGTDKIVAYLKQILQFKITEPDAEDRTIDIIRGVDMQFGLLYKLIKDVDRTLNHKLVMEFSGEQSIFISFVLKESNPSIIHESVQIINSPPSDIFNNVGYHSLAFNSINYLLAIRYFSNFSELLLNTPVRFIAMKYLSVSASHSSEYHKRRLGFTTKPNFTVSWATPSTLHWLVHNSDLFSVELLYWLVRSNESLATPELFNDLNLVLSRIDVLSVSYLRFIFDLYFIYINLPDKQYISLLNIEIIDKIFANELVDLYSYAFYYISMLVGEGRLGPEFVLNILQHDAIWNEHSWHSSLVCMLIAAFNHKIIHDEQIVAVSGALNEFNSTILIYKTTGKTSKENNKPEIEYILGNKLDETKIVNNFIDKKYVRILIKKMIADGIREDIIKRVADKNDKWIEYEHSMLHGPIVYFDI